MVVDIYPLQHLGVCMSRPRWGVRTARRDALTLLVAVAAVVTVVLAGPRPPAAVANPNQLFVYRVAAASDEAVQRLFDRGFDVLEDRSGADVLVLGNAATAHRLRAAGFAAAVVEKVETGGWQPPSTRLVPDAKPLAVAPIDETYDGGYHTVRAQYAHLDDVNGTSCPRRPSGSGQTRVELNRNNANHRRGASTSRNPCSEDYPGPAG